MLMPSSGRHAPVLSLIARIHAFIHCSLMSKSPVPRWDALGSGHGFRSTATAWDLRWWILAATLTSIVVHAGLFVAIKRLKIPGRSVAEDMLASPQTGTFEFDLEQVTVASDAVQRDLTPEPADLSQKQETTTATAALPDLTELAEAIRDRAVVLTPAISTPTANLNLSTPAPGTSGDLLDDPSTVRQSLAGDLKDSLLSRSTLTSPSEIAPDDSQLLIEGAASSGSADLKDDVLKSLKKGSGGNGGLDGFASLDDLFNHKGPVTGDFKTMLRTDLLFDFGSAQLRPDARLSLMKLGAIIQNNAGATFRLIGHTDTIGAPATNQTLSEARATAVRDWLVSSLRLDGTNIIVEGRGESEPLPDLNPNGSPDEQQLNRRVEIHKSGG